MADFFNGTYSEVLDFYESENYQYVKGVTTTITSGNFVKLPTNIYFFIDLSAIYNTVKLPTPQYFGFQNNNEILNLEFTNEE